MPTARSRAALNKPAEEKTPGPTVTTNPLRALLLDMASVLTTHANQMPLTTADPDADLPPWDNAGSPVADQEPEPVAEEKPTPPPAKKATKAAMKKAAPEPDPEPAVAAELTAAEYLEQLEEMDVAALRALAVEMEWDEASVAKSPAKEIIEAIMGEKYPEETADAGSAAAGDPDVETEPEEAPASNGVTREELTEMNLPALRKLAASLEIPEETYKPMDIDAITDLIMSYQEGGAAEEEGFSEEDLRNMSRKQLWELATNPEDDAESPGYGMQLAKNTTAEQIIQLLLGSATEDEDAPPY